LETQIPPMNAEEAPESLGSRGGLLHGELTESIIGCFYEVYNTLGFGLLEKAYANALSVELKLRGHRVRSEVPTDLWYKGVHIARYKTDRVVDERVIIEVKSTQVLNREDPRQLLNFLKATDWEVGLLLHFGPAPKFYRLIASNRNKPRRSPK
jgi:GxxExxY protein